MNKFICAHQLLAGRVIKARPLDRFALLAALDDVTALCTDEDITLPQCLYRLGKRSLALNRLASAAA